MPSTEEDEKSDSLAQQLPNSRVHKSHLEFVKIQILELIPRDPDSTGVGWSLGSCISKKIQ